MSRRAISYNLCVFSLVLLAPWQSGSCRGAKTKPMLKEQNHVAAGVWGGPNIQLEVTGDGARIRFNCASGAIARPIVTDGEGRFSAEGTFTPQTPGPTREDIPPKDQPATYSGSVRDNSMTLTVTLTETKEEVATFSLEHGKTGRLFRCH